MNEIPPPKQEPPQNPQLPDWAIHISEVYAWASKPRRFGASLTKRAIQWYSSSRLIPSPQRIGKEAYYNRNTIFSYLRVIDILNRKFGLLLSEIHSIIRKAEALGEHDGCMVTDVDDEGNPDMEYPVVVLSNLLEEYLEYEENEISQCDRSVDGPEFSPEQTNRLGAISQAILNDLRGNGKKFERLFSEGILALEKRLYPDGKIEEPPF